MTENMNQLAERIHQLIPGEIPRVFPDHPEGPLELLLVGNPQQNLIGILNEFIEGLDELDYPMASGYRCTIMGGKCKAAFLADGEEAVPAEVDAISDKLRKYHKRSMQYRFTLTLDDPVMEDCRITVLASDSDFEDVNWNLELSGCDYLLFAMSSTALFSMSERKTIRTWLMPDMGKRMGVVLTNDNLVLGDDREDIRKSLENVFHGAIPIFRMPGTDTEKLKGFVEELKEEKEGLHAERGVRAEKIFLHEAKKAVALQVEVLSGNKTDLEDVIDIMKETAAKLPDRQKSACRRARIQYTTPVKLEASEMMGTFQQDLDKQLKSEIEQGTDIEEMKEILPSYIADAWKRESERLLEVIQARMASMQKDLEVYMEKDIRNYIEGIVGGDKADYIYALADKYVNLKDSFTFHSDGKGFRYEAPRDDTKIKYYGVIASGIALVMFSHPIIGIAVATLGSHKIKEDSKKMLQFKSRSALNTACDAMNRDCYEDLMRCLETVFASMEQNITTCIEECYQKMIDTMIQALHARNQDQNSYRDQLTELEALKEAIIGRLADIG